MATYARPVSEFAGIEAKEESHSSGVSWAAVFAGAFAAGALSLILMSLGAGMGLSSLSPWPNSGMSATRVGEMGIVWLILAQIIASAVGGYLAGRLRTKWVAVHTHEVYFRDTAHGFLVWAVALVISSLAFASYATSITRSASIASSGTNETQMATGNEYFVDTLFRTDRPMAAESNDTPMRTEAGLILANALRQSDMSSPDKTYLANEVAARTGVTQAEAQRRVDDTMTAYRQAADTARKAVAHSLYWIFVALLIGAFCASYAATFGGRQRDNIPH
jgi:hypothetical protein